MPDRFHGLPKEVYEELIKAEQRISVQVTKRKYGKPVTIIEGLDPKEVDLDELATNLKKSLACGGTVKNGKIELQGNHKDRIKKILVKHGFSAENIEIK